MPRMRWWMIGLCFLATTINYVDRATLSVAAPFIQHDLGLNSAVMGMLLGAFFWTYAIMQLPAGWIVDRIGARRAYAIAVGWWSIFTAATAVANSAGAMFSLRLALGVGEAAAYPANSKVAALWFPRNERGLAAGIFDSGSRAGSALSLPIVGAIVAFAGWRWAFVGTGLLGIAWLLAWLMMYRDPAQHRLVDSDQLARLRAAQPQPSGTPVNWLALFRYKTVWGMMLGFFCLNFVNYFFTTWFPTYLLEVRGFSLRQLGTVGVAPALAAVPAAWLGGWTSDALHRRGWSLTAARKTCLVGGMLLSTSITFSAFVPSIVAAIGLFTLSYASIAFAAANVWALPGDVAPSPGHVASLSGIQNCAANFSGIVMSVFTGAMLTITNGSFVIPLCVAGGFCIVGAFSFLFIVGKIEPLGPSSSREASGSVALDLLS